MKVPNLLAERLEKSNKFRVEFVDRYAQIKVPNIDFHLSAERSEKVPNSDLNVLEERFEKGTKFRFSLAG